MNLRKPVAIAGALTLVGGVFAVFWVRQIGGAEFLGGLAQLNPLFLVPLLGATAWFLFVRFIRWQFLLRQAGVRIPTRPSLSVYLASLVGTATPAYVGEVALRSAFNRIRFNVPVRVTVWVFLVERTLDVVVLAALGVLTGLGTRGALPMVVAAAAGLAAVLLLVHSSSGFRVPRDGMRRPGMILQAVLLSLAAWLPASLLPALAGAGISEAVAPLASISIFSTSTLLGGATLMPAGVASTGGFAILMLQDLGMALGQAVVVVSIVRLTSTGVVMIVSAVFLLFELVAKREPESADHFDEIAVEYSDQFQPHIWDYLLDRKITFMTDHLEAGAGPGLDLGCGMGRQCIEMGRRGFPTLGLDISVELLKQARRDGVPVVNGSALELPFADNSLGFCYSIGVLHHLWSAEAQEVAFKEVTRVLAPGAHFMVHETNPRNPLFRFYMGYVFPLLKSIDEGVENWIDTTRWERIEGLEVVDVVYFTFLPDFIPSGLMKPFQAVERWLERGPFRPYSVHYLAVMRKVEGASAGVADRSTEVVG